MVHNGIEYGDMQLICEAYHLMKVLYIQLLSIWLFIKIKHYYLFGCTLIAIFALLNFLSVFPNFYKVFEKGNYNETRSL